MSESMGQIIKRLRKERNFTQEELAEQLNVSPQAVSKWENGTSMPDISQVVPIANVFGVSTDLLFGTAGTSGREEVEKIINHAQSFLKKPLTAEYMKKMYFALQDGLKKYPNNAVLLMASLEAGISLAYPENSVYDPKVGKEIYEECIRQANIVTSYSANAADELRAHMIMVLLHSAYGNFGQARAHAEKFPVRPDMNIHEMYAYYAHWKQDYKTEAGSCQYGIFYYLESMLNILVRLAQTYSVLQSYKDAAQTLEYALKLIDITVGEEKVIPPLHYREKGNIYILLAEAYLKLGDESAALDCLERLAAYDIEECEKFSRNPKISSPLLRDVGYDFYRLHWDRLHHTQEIFKDDRFASLKDNPRYIKLAERVESMKY